MTVVVTGAWSYSGVPIARALLTAGYEVVSLTGRSVPDPDPHRGRVPAVPYGRFSVPELARLLDGAEALHCGYWTRHDRAPVGHRGPWTSHVQAVHHSARLVEAARLAGVCRLVWTSIANPGLDPDLSYYRQSDSCRRENGPFCGAPRCGCAQ